MTKTIDYIIVGLGLAGACLTMQLVKRNKRVLVIDNPATNRATAIAAGLFNPITGKVMGKTWMAETLFPYLDQFYREAEILTNSTFFNPMPLYRPFVSIQEQNDWMGNTNSYTDSFVQEIYTKPTFIEEVKNPFGGLLLQHCGFINTNEFCLSVKNYLEQSDSFLTTEFQFDKLEIFDDYVSYGQQRSRKIVFCDGVRALTNQYFNWLPIKPLKGETLTIKPSVKPNQIYNRGVYLVPELWKVGATYSNSDSSEMVTEKGRNELIEKLEDLIAMPYQIINHEWGMRPTTPDRKPILGKHPKYGQMAIFNGLGTKGVSLAPYFSEVLVNHLENGVALNNEVDINRYKSLYWKSA